MRVTSIASIALFVAACSKDKPADYPPTASTSSVETPSASRSTTTDTSIPMAPAPAPAPAATPASATTRSAPDAVPPSASTTTGSVPPAAGSGTRQPDNTGVNERDRSASALTPMDQGNSESDRKLTQQIRKSVMGDKSLSFTAKNVKIITKNGLVTLRGPVKTEAEKASIDALARQASGDHIDDQLEVKK